MVGQAIPNPIGTNLGSRAIFPTMRAAPLTLILFLLCAGMATAQQYGLRTFTIEEGLPSATVNDLCEDRDGFLWIATDAGAARSNGSEFITYGQREGLPCDEVTAVYAAHDGRVWLGCRSGAIATWRDGTITVLGTERMLPQVPVKAFAEDQDGVLHYATLGAGVFRLEGGKATLTSRGRSTPSATVRALVADPQGRLLAGSDSGLHMLDAGQWTKLPANSNLLERSVTALHSSKKGVLVGTLSGFTELDKDLRPLPPMARITGVFPIALPDPRVLSILRTSTGDIWVGTPSGIGHLSKRGGIPSLRVIGEANGLGHNEVRCLLEDRSGGIWAGTAFGGISRSTSEAFIHFTDRDGLRSRIVTAIHRSPVGELWIGTLGGGVALWQDGSLRSFGKEQGLTDPLVLCLGEDREGWLLVGTTVGLFRSNGKGFTPVDLGVHKGPLRIFAIHTDANGDTWVATDQGLHLRRTMDRYQRVKGSAMAVQAITSAADTLWAATDKGLYRVHAKADTLKFVADGRIPAVSMTSIARDSQANLWIGTESNGLFRLRGNHADTINAGNGLSSNAVEQVLLDAYENVWIGTRRGIHYIELDVLQERIIGISHYGSDDGFIGVEAFRNACMLDQDSSLWFGSVRGATRYAPQLVTTDEREPLIQLTALKLFFEDVDWSPWASSLGRNGIPEGLVLPYDRNHLTMLFEGISLAYPEKLRYRYILEGYDPDWSPITTTDRVTYSNIPPGDYTFRVMARNGSGIWNETPLSLPFTIRPPFWATLPFQLIAGLVLVLGVIGIVRIRERRLRQDRARLEGMVASRTGELAKEKERSDDLLLNILPASIAEELKQKGSANALSHPSCTVLFSDFTGFTTFSSHMDSDTLVAELDHYFRLFDRLCDRYGVEKIKTIGDAYMCASGVPQARSSHALNCVLMALGMLEAVGRSNAERQATGRQQWPIRIGLHSGPLVSGVVGEKKFAYDIWGDTVNLASRMESNSEPGRLNISGSTYAEVMDYLEVEPRGPVKVKGKGELHMYFVLRLKPEWSADEAGLLPNEALLAERERSSA